VWPSGQTTAGAARATARRDRKATRVLKAIALLTGESEDLGDSKSAEDMVTGLVAFICFPE